MEENDSDWRVGDENVTKVVEDYFSGIFSSLMLDSNAVMRVIDGLNMALPPKKRLPLERPFSKEDIENVFLIYAQASP